MAAHKIAVLVGSLRRESYTRKIARALIAMAPAALQMEIVEIGDLPIYNQDLDEAGPVPPQWLAFRDRVRPLRGVLFATPEYNRSVPGVLKNAIDVGSRPHGHSVWSKKPCAVVSVSPGAIGGFGANHHLRQSLVFLGMPTLQREAYIGGVDKLLDADGNLSKPETREFLAGILRDFAAWVELNSAAPAAIS
jgi:chromate reductase